jgi:hypothetical protein
MKKLIFIIIVICFPLSSANAKTKLYWIDKGITVLAFIGNPYSQNIIPIKLTSSKKQKIRLFHKKSGPGIYAFYLKGLSIKNKHGQIKTVTKRGFFLVKRSQTRLHEYKRKYSMKNRTQYKKQKVFPYYLYEK